MPFSKGNTLGRSNRGKKKQSRKTIYMLESLLEHGYDFESTLVKMLNKAAQGDPQAYAMAQLLVKLVPSIAHAPRSADTVTNIEQLVIARFDRAHTATQAHNPSIDTELAKDTTVDHPIDSSTIPKSLT